MMGVVIELSKLPRAVPSPLSETRHQRIERAKKIIAEVAEAHNFSVDVLTGESRCHQIVIARRIGMKRVFAETGLGTPTIGKLFGDRDHTTVLHAIRKATMPNEAKI